MGEAYDDDIDNYGIKNLLDAGLKLFIPENYNWIVRRLEICEITGYSLRIHGNFENNNLMGDACDKDANTKIY